jgi:hypothetical protein
MNLSRRGHAKIPQGKVIDTSQFGRSTVSLIFRSPATLQMVSASCRPADGNLGAWFSNFPTWAGQTDADWCWWLLDGTMCQGTTRLRACRKVCRRDVYRT